MVASWQEPTLTYVEQCDGATPACSTCIAVYRTDCYYDAESDHRRKGALRRDLQSLQQRSDALDVIVTALQSVPEDESVSLLRTLREDIGLEVLADSLRRNVDLPKNFDEQTLEGEFADQLSSAPSSSRSTAIALSISREDSGDTSQPRSGAISPLETSNRWLRYPCDPELVEHLLTTYFCWIHPFYQFFSRNHFINDMNRGQEEYCSSLLVNAVLSYASLYTDRPSTHMDARTPGTAGDEFFSEAKRQLVSSTELLRR